MAKGSRTGQRQRREQRALRRPSLGYYIVATDTEETEKSYFDGLRDSLPEELRRELIIKTFETKTADLIETCLREMGADPQFRQGWIVFDRDRVMDFDKIISLAAERGIHPGWSNPCFEIWMYAYYGKMPAVSESWNLWKQFGAEYEKHTGTKYVKSAADIYQRLVSTGNERNAIRLAELKLQQCIREGRKHPSEMCPATMVHLLIGDVARLRETRKGRERKDE